MAETKNQKALYSDILSMSPRELAAWLDERCIKNIPINLESADQLKEAGALLGKLTNIYSYLMAALTFAKLTVREKKRNKADKSEIDDAVDRKDILENFALTIKQQYTAISRMIAVKKQVDDEMRMV